MANKKRGWLIIAGIILAAIIISNQQKPETQKIFGVFGGIQLEDITILTPTITNDDQLKVELQIQYPVFHLPTAYIVELGIKDGRETQAFVTKYVGPGSNCDYELGTVDRPPYPTKFFENEITYNFDVVDSFDILNLFVSPFSRKYVFEFERGLMDATPNGLSGLSEGEHNLYLSLYNIKGVTSDFSFKKACEKVRDTWPEGKTEIYNIPIGTFTITKEGPTNNQCTVLGTQSDCEKNTNCMWETEGPNRCILKPTNGWLAILEKYGLWIGLAFTAIIILSIFTKK